MSRARIGGLAILVISFSPELFGQENGDIRELKLRDWKPKSMLITKATEVPKPAFPAIDVHNHLGGGRQVLTPERVQHYLTEMDAAGVRAAVNLDGGWGERLKGTLAALDNAHPGRFLTYALIDFSGIDEPGWSDREATRLKESFEAGAKGLKFHKTFGLGVRYSDGRYMPVDDPKLDPIWEVCANTSGRSKFTRLIPARSSRRSIGSASGGMSSTNTPTGCFTARAIPAAPTSTPSACGSSSAIRRRPSSAPTWPTTAKISPQVAEWLDRYPNMYVDIDARISELGRQPYSARRFLIKYQDRVMFGTDTPPSRAAYRIYYRFLETDDEYFDPAGGHHPQGFWMIYGVFLPRDVLEKLYVKNAERLLFGLAGQGK